MADKETRGFAAEAKQLLQLMIHSLYSNREIFLRELISNASDALDKLRLESLTRTDLVTGEAGVWIDIDKPGKRLVIRDNGIGMSRDEVIDHLGTIAKSGTAEFMKRLSGDERKDAQLIGQFGVGFYSAFIVADRVEVFTRRAGDPVEAGTRWESAGEADYSVEDVVREEAGTEVVLHVKADAEEFLDSFRLRNVIRRYSDHIAVPVHLRKESFAGADDESGKDDAAAEPEFEVVNQAKALWTRSRTDVTDDEYKAFYKHIAHAFDEPLTWSHNKVEGKLEFTSLLYVPKQAPFDLWNREAPRGLRLYVQRVFILDQAEQFLPLYLRFVKGVVDCADLPLNVSREILQNDKRVETIKLALTKRVLDMLKKLAKDDAEAYQGFWNEFGRVLKEAPAEDFGNKEDVAKLFRFASTHAEGDAQVQSLEDYVGRMKPGQTRIYYVCADSHRAALASPHLEVFRKRGIEVLVLGERIDDWVMTTLREFDGKQLTDITRGDLGLDAIETPEAEAADEAKKDDAPKAAEGLLERVKDALGDEVEEVRYSERLVSSPACLVIGEHDMGAQMRKLLEAAGQEVPDSKPSLELNASHPLVVRLDAEVDEDQFGELAHVLLDQARLAEGGQLPDPGAFVNRLNKLLLSLAGRAA
jgi:molecular chaperone HtpG